MDQRWQQLEAHIDKLIGRFLQNGFPAIEYKPRYLALLQLPPEYKKEEMENIS